MRVRCCALIIDEGKVLVLRYEYPKGLVFAIPGGGIEAGETMSETLVREFQEELGLKIEIGRLLYNADMMARAQVPQTVHIVFEGRIVSGNPQIDPQHTSAVGVEWLDVADLKGKNLYPAINGAIMADWQTGDFAARYLGDCEARDWA